MNFQTFKLDLEKAEEPEIKLPTSIGSLKKQNNTRKISALLIMPKPFAVWITINCGNFLIPDHLTCLEKSVHRSRSKSEPDMEQGLVPN